MHQLAIIKSDINIGLNLDFYLIKKSFGYKLRNNVIKKYFISKVRIKREFKLKKGRIEGTNFQ